MLPIDPEALFYVLMLGPYVTQIPRIALTARRLRDQYANPLALIWFLVPFLGGLATPTPGRAGSR